MDIVIDNLIWDDFNVNHIKKHSVSQKEIIDALSNIKLSFKSYQSRLLIIGQTKNNRFLSIVLTKTDHQNYYVITARDTSRSEKKLINL